MNTGPWDLVEYSSLTYLDLSGNPLCGDQPDYLRVDYVSLPAYISDVCYDSSIPRLALLLLAPVFAALFVIIMSFACKYVFLRQRKPKGRKVLINGRIMYVPDLNANQVLPAEMRNVPAL